VRRGRPRNQVVQYAVGARGHGGNLITVSEICTLAAPTVVSAPPTVGAVHLPPCAPFVKRILKHPRVMHYNRLVAVVLAGNIACAV
jgi:hypothetical protein